MLISIKNDKTRKVKKKICSLLLVFLMNSLSKGESFSHCTYEGFSLAFFAFFFGFSQGEILLWKKGGEFFYGSFVMIFSLCF